MNKFKRTYNYKYTPLTVDLIPHCLELEEKWCEEHDCEDEESLINERKALNTALRNFDALGLVGGALWVDDEIVGFTYGAPVNHDTFAVHIEKADSRIDGSYSILNQEFARHIPEQYVYLNREEDLGIPGLRKAKLSYHPVILLEKSWSCGGYVLTIRKSSFNSILTKNTKKRMLWCIGMNKVQLLPLCRRLFTQ